MPFWRIYISKIARDTPLPFVARYSPHAPSLAAAAAKLAIAASFYDKRINYNQ
jgi:hypothetical protein